jgi:hypothetical protein
MQEIVVEEPVLHREPDSQRLSAELRLGGIKQTMWFKLPVDLRLTTDLDPFLIAILTTAMRHKVRLKLAGPVTQRLSASVDKLQAIYSTWYADLSPVLIQFSSIVDRSNERPQSTASFFSGGVDAFFTALKNDQRLSGLILVHGFDIALNRTDLRKQVSRSVNEAAKLLGKQLIEVETNSRVITEPHSPWPRHFGAALASVAAVLSTTYGSVLVPSSESYAHLEPHGSHPLVDPLWSTDRVSIEYDGGEASRHEKVAYIANNAAAMKYLRVCWRNPDNSYNCGECEKCLRTMLALMMVDALDKCETLPRGLTATTVKGIKIPADSIFYHFEEHLTALHQNGKYPDIAAALECVVTDYLGNKLGRELSALPVFPENAPSLADALERHRDAIMHVLHTKNRRQLISSLLKLLVARRTAG